MSANSSRGRATVPLILVSLISALNLLPIYWMVTGSFKKNADFNAVPPQWFPADPTLGNWSLLLGGGTAVNTDAWRWVGNSLIVSLGTVLISVCISALMGYAFARKQFPGRKPMFALVLITMMMPIQVIIVPLFLIVRTLGLYNTYLGMMVPLLVYPFGIVMIRQFMAQLPGELFEAARLDGCSEWKQFWRVAVPLSGPALAALAIFTFFTSWNNFMWQLVIARDEMLMTLPVGIGTLAFGGSSGRVDYGVLMAGATFGAIPMVLFFIVFQRYFVKGISAGAVKG